MTRERLPNRRPAERIEFEFSSFRCLATVGRTCTTADGLLSFGPVKEVFIDVIGMKTGTDFLASARDGGLMISIALQAGITLETLAESLSRRHDGSAAGVMGAACDAILEHFGEREKDETRHS